MTDREIINHLHQIGDLEALRQEGGARFKAAAFHKAAIELAKQTAPLRGITDLTSVPHVGRSVAECVQEMLKRGTCTRLTTLRATVKPSGGHDAVLAQLEPKVYEGVMEMTRVRGLGPKKALKLYEEDKIDSFAALVKAAKAGRLADAKLTAAVLEAAARKHDRVPLALALPIIHSIRERLLQLPGVLTCREAGSARRRKSDIGDCDLLVAVKHHADRIAVVQAFQRLVPKAHRGVAGEQKARISWNLGPWGLLQIDLLVVPPEEWGAALNYFTGSKDWNIAVRARAKKLGLKVNEHGIYRGARRVGGTREHDLFRLLHIPWTPPVLRESMTLPTREATLVTLDDLVADWHVHTKWSDGSATVEAVIQTAIKRGLKLVGIADHSYMVKANFDAYVQQLRRLQHKYRHTIQVRIGIECDIKVDGTLELSQAKMMQLDFVIAAIHRKHAEQVEARLLAAIQQPLVTIIAHPTGRNYSANKDARDIPTDVNWAKVFHAAAAQGVALEINGQPSRLDLPAELVAQARSAGCCFTLGSDAHRQNDVGALRYALDVVRRGGLRVKDLRQD
jgi:DNA polymerase (family 10)